MSNHDLQTIPVIYILAIESRNQIESIYKSAGQRTRARPGSQTI